jgi:hypothetical protein
MTFLHLFHSPLFWRLAMREKVLMEPEYSNTREHVEEILKFEGITKDTPLGVVSSEWHLRRVKMVFEWEFGNVRLLGAPGRKVWYGVL